MILEIQHETQFDYSEPVTEAITEVRLEPVSDPDQTCSSFRLKVAPRTELNHYADGFGNRVHHFNVLEPHNQLRVHAASVVQTHPRQRNLSRSSATYPPKVEGIAWETIRFAGLHGPVRGTPLLAPVLDALRPAAGSRLADLLLSVSKFIHTKFEYAKHVTQASSPIDDVLRAGKGVCQDFAHLMIAILRSFDVPARYVSGYLHRPNKESQSHAWVEAWLPDLGWVAIDPTNDKLVDESFVKVAIGRDFSDVPPNKGSYCGQAGQKMSVRVETRMLEFLPSLSWQDQLPPLNVPLTAVVSRPAALGSAGDADQQQQQ